MTDHPSGSGPWWILILDRSERDDPRWLLAEIRSAADVCPAGAEEEAPDEVADRWLRGRNGGGPHRLTLMCARCWRIDTADG